MVGVSGIGLNHRNHRIRGNEAGDVVDVAVSVVTHNAAAQPDHGFNSQVISEDFFVIFVTHAGIALLLGAEQAFFRG